MPQVKPLWHTFAVVLSMFTRPAYNPRRNNDRDQKSDERQPNHERAILSVLNTCGVSNCCSLVIGVITPMSYSRFLCRMVLHTAFNHVGLPVLLGLICCLLCEPGACLIHSRFTVFTCQRLQAHSRNQIEISRLCQVSL